MCLHVLAAKSSIETRNSNKIYLGNRFRVSKDFQKIESEKRELQRKYEINEDICVEIIAGYGCRWS